MAIAARLEQLPEIAGAPREPRRALRLEVQGSLSTGDPANVLVHNISATGMLIESRMPLAAGERIGIDLPHAGATWGQVVWTSGDYFGCRFDDPVSPATLNAAQLRSAVGRQDSGPTAQPHHTDESFGRRIGRLRKQRGMTLSHLADRLGVSKPTVWAWEHGKARPVEARIEALAEALGVLDTELVSGEDRQDLDEMLARSREEIARAFGTRPDKIRIMIEL